ncbi:MAG: intradiol ring-cleavage dioxygenase [Gaiellaceae bacterium]
MDEDTRFSRRETLAKLGGLVAGAAAVGGLKAADSLSVLDDETSSSGPAGVASGAVTCVLAPEQTEGPYYLDDAKVRRNITEGKAGVPLTLKLKVVDASRCKPIRSALVDVWHCDAGGVYSGVQGAADDLFLRGVQRTDATGVATFRTIYPGWYPGRTVHIHVMAHIGGNVVHTGQLYFPDSITDAAYRRSPYNRRPNRDPRNAGDSIYRNGGKRSTLKLVRSGSGYVGSIAMGVVRS